MPPQPVCRAKEPILTFDISQLYPQKECLLMVTLTKLHPDSTFEVL